MDQVVGVIVGAAAALLGSALTSLLAPWVARRWQRVDRDREQREARDAALRAAVEGYLTALWAMDATWVEGTIVPVKAKIVDMIAAVAVVHQHEARVGLLLRPHEVEILDLMERMQGLLMKRHRGDAPKTEKQEVHLFRKESARLFSGWLQGSISPSDALSQYVNFRDVVWSAPVEEKSDH